jgi:hypothetical protein
MGCCYRVGIVPSPWPKSLVPSTGSRDTSAAETRGHTPSGLTLTQQTAPRAARARRNRNRRAAILAVNGSPRELRPLPRHSDLGGLIDVTFYSFTYYGGLLASERVNLSVAFFLLEAHFFVVTALRFYCYILAQKSADARHFWQVYALLERRRVRAVPIQPRRRTDRPAPVPAQRLERTARNRAEYHRSDLVGQMARHGPTRHLRSGRPGPDTA